MVKANQALRTVLQDSGVHHWEVAAELGISRYTLINWLRTELPEEKKRKIISACRKIAESRDYEGAAPEIRKMVTEGGGKHAQRKEH